MFNLILDNYRCFPERQNIPLAPLTLLVGENSSGKSSVLAAIAAVSQRPQFPIKTDFNQPPYALGNFASIANTRRSRRGQTTRITIGYETEVPHLPLVGDKTSTVPVTVLAEYEDANGLPSLARLSISMTHFSFVAERASLKAVLSDPNNPAETQELATEVPEALINDRAYYPYALGQSARQKGTPQDPEMYFRLHRLINSPIDTISPTLSLAPVRTRPQRTYDQLRDDFEAEGSHVPLLLSRILPKIRKSATKTQLDLLTRLQAFGKESGLFKYLRPHTLGSRPGSPFQLLIGHHGQRRNLADVGYGVSQSLPIVVQAALAEARQRILIQQPEVHLHPRAQAALGTYFFRTARQKRCEFVIETHSDYLVDRVRQEVARTPESHKDVRILFFESGRARTLVHSLGLEADGSISGAPSTYRRFFIDEELRLLRRSGH